MGLVVAGPYFGFSTTFETPNVEKLVVIKLQINNDKTQHGKNTLVK